MVTTQYVSKTQRALRLHLGASGLDNSKMTGHNEQEQTHADLLTMDQTSYLSDKDPVWDFLKGQFMSKSNEEKYAACTKIWFDPFYGWKAGSRPSTPQRINVLHAGVTVSR